jgi:transposase-like protein
MNPYSSLTEQQRVAAVGLFEAGYGHKSTAVKLGVGRQAVGVLFERWRIHGREALVEKRTKRQYSFETKLEIVRRYLAGEPAMELCEEFGLSSRRLLTKWARLFGEQGEDGLRPKPKGRPPSRPAPEPGSELERLRAENERLRAEVAYLGKLKALRIRSGSEDTRCRCPHGAVLAAGAAGGGRSGAVDVLGPDPRLAARGDQHPCRR